ncbi:MAG: endonuclease/exonuclease/phosphatase family protein [Thermodesulfobacteriota bacterium]
MSSVAGREPRSGDQEAPSLVVVTVNLLHGPPLFAAQRARGSVLQRLDTVAEQLARAAPDVVLLQEASRSARHDNTARLLADKLGMEWRYARANPAWLWRLGDAVKRLLPDLEFEEGPAILSRLPILEERVHRLSSRFAPFEQRVALEAVLGGPRGPFSVYSVHLTAFSAAERRRQIVSLLRAVASSRHHHPLLVGGDFNADEHAHEIRLLTGVRGWADAYREIHPEAVGHTWGQALAAASATAGKRIDFLFSVAAGDERWKPSQARLILDSASPVTSDGVLWASDHYGVVARFELAASDARGGPPAAGATLDHASDPPAAARLLDWELPAAYRARAVELVAGAATRVPGDDWQHLPEALRARDEGRIRAVIGYGSWYTPNLRKPSSFPDIYVVVDDYARFHDSALRAWMNRRLPPNVHFVWETTADGVRLAGKYNVIDVPDLERECGPGPGDLYNAGRLSKLVWIAWAESDALRAWLVERLVDANQTVTAIVAGLLPERFSARTFSLELLAVSYRGEARLEGWERIRALRAAHAAFYDELHPLLLDGFAAATGLLVRERDHYRKLPHPAWDELAESARRMVRRSRSRGYLRWARIVLTEPHLADLAANEAERKAGVKIAVTDRLRRHPLLLGLPAFLRVLRERNTRERIRRVP